jgi:hypothetical protein
MIPEQVEMTSERLDEAYDTLLYIAQCGDGKEEDALNDLFTHINAQAKQIAELENSEETPQTVRDFVELCANGYYRQSTVEDVARDAVHLLSDIDNARG